MLHPGARMGICDQDGSWFRAVLYAHGCMGCGFGFNRFCEETMRDDLIAALDLQARQPGSADLWSNLAAEIILLRRQLADARSANGVSNSIALLRDATLTRAHLRQELALLESRGAASLQV